MSRLIPNILVEQRIFVVRRQKVMLDEDLAQLYEILTRRLNEQVKRNLKRFPEDFMFQLTLSEHKELTVLRSQIAISKGGGRRYRPYVFTEQGVAMLSGVLNSDRAVQVNIAIMRAFVRLREMLVTHKGLAGKLKDLERRMEQQDSQIHAIFQAIRKLMEPSSETKKSKIGFHSS